MFQLSTATTVIKVEIINYTNVNIYIKQAENKRFSPFTYPHYIINAINIININHELQVAQFRM